ncbi:glutaminyl-peptide cyclotransferase [Corynebacterium sp. LaCa116]|uniref:glutaminyl-peptide cyclotransferase n=1 Tax=Corynebacterium sp. LaCa116 TaxID=3391423 RepID=UPI0039890BF7
MTDMLLSLRSSSHSLSLRLLATTCAAATAVCGLSSCTSETDNTVSEPQSSTAAPPAASPVAGAEPERLGVTVLEKTTMLPGAFTQGLEVDQDGNLLIGTGMYGESKLLRVRPGSRHPLEEISLNNTYFGEGITQTDHGIWQLTWKSGTAILHDATTFTETNRVSYEGEGWGLCNAGAELIMSDGSDQLRHVDPKTFDEVSPRTQVTLDGKTVDNLNELECVDGAVYANVWMSKDILRIDPATGQVTAVIDTTGLEHVDSDDPNAVLNGIAHIPGTDEFWVTGKRWDDLYRVRFE